MAEFRRELRLDPAYDRGPEYGIHGVEMRFLLHGDAGTVQFVLYTNWQLPHVTPRFHAPYDAIGGDAHWMERPMPVDLGYHSPVPLYEGQSLLTESCPVLGGRPCYYDGSSLNAEPVFHRLLAEGDAGVWAELEAYYTRTFARAEPGGFRASSARTHHH